MGPADVEDDTWPSSRGSSSSLDLKVLSRSEKAHDLESQYRCHYGFKMDPRMVSDAIIGLSDGLTVPFALTAGLSGLGSTQIVIYGGLAELIAGAISMGLGGYLAAKSELESYNATLSRTRTIASVSPSAIADSVSSIFHAYDLPPALTAQLSAHMSTSAHAPSFLMHFSQQQTEPASTRALTCALTIALGYFIGGFVPLVPYFLVAENAVYEGLAWSVGCMACALFGFGFFKTSGFDGDEGGGGGSGGDWAAVGSGGSNAWGNVWGRVRGGGEMVVVGGVAAGAAMGIVRVFRCWEGNS